MAEKLTERRILQAYQCDRFGNVRPLILMNELQSIADRHAELLGCGRTYCLENGVGWVVMYYLVDIIELPTEGEETPRSRGFSFMAFHSRVVEETYPPSGSWEAGLWHPGQW